VTLASGFVLLVAGILAWLAGVHVKALRYFDRPAPARSPMFDPAISLLAWLLGAAGLAQIGRGSVPALADTLLVLLGLWGYRRFIRSASFQRRLLRRDLEALRKEHPGAEERALLYQLVYRRHPRWGEELIEQMVLDYPTVDDLARIVAKMERGFRGFRP